MKVVLRDSAVADLEDIHAWIAVERPLTADKVVDRIFASVQILKLFPESGRPGRVEGTRELVVPRLPYIVIYEVAYELDAVLVTAVVHGARDR
jgi:plasmid stabilization system protein ParE